MRSLSALDLCLRVALADLCRDAAVELDVRGSVIDDHAALGVAANHGRRDLERAHEGARHPAVADEKPGDLAGLRVVLGV